MDDRARHSSGLRGADDDALAADAGVGIQEALLAPGQHVARRQPRQRYRDEQAQGGGTIIQARGDLEITHHARDQGDEDGQRTEGHGSDGQIGQGSELQHGTHLHLRGKAEPCLTKSAAVGLVPAAGRPRRRNGIEHEDTGLRAYLQRVGERPRLLVKIILHFCAAQPNFEILEYKLHDEVRWAVGPYLPKDGYLAFRRNRPGWGIEIDESALHTNDYVHWERKLPIRPDGSTAYV
jgi:hypothetical protein